MTEYSDNLTEADVEAVLRALPDHEITGDEIAMIISEIVLRFCDSPLEGFKGYTSVMTCGDLFNAHAALAQKGGEA